MYVCVFACTPATGRAGQISTISCSYVRQGSPLNFSFSRIFQKISSLILKELIPSKIYFIKYVFFYAFINKLINEVKKLNVYINFYVSPLVSKFSWSKKHIYLALGIILTILIHLNSVMCFCISYVIVLYQEFV